MSRLITGLSAAAAAGILAFAASPAQAVLVQYSASGDSTTFEMTPTALNTTVTLDAYSDSVDLTPGVAQELLINGGEVDVFQGATASGADSLTQTLTVQGGGSKSITQAVSVVTSAPSPPFVPASADAAVFAGVPVTFTLGGGAYELTVTPLGGTRTGQEMTTFPIFNNAQFLLTVVPEPATGLLACAAGGLLLARRRGASRSL